MYLYRFVALKSGASLVYYAPRHGTIRHRSNPDPIRRLTNSALNKVAIPARSSRTSILILQALLMEEVEPFAVR